MVRGILHCRPSFRPILEWQEEVPREGLAGTALLAGGRDQRGTGRIY